MIRVDPNITSFSQANSPRELLRSFTMTKFVHVDMPVSHPGTERLENAVATLQAAVSTFSAERAMASMLLAAVVSALLLAASALIQEVTDGHLLLAWMALWLVGFVALALLAKPTKRLAHGLRARWAASKQARFVASQDDRLWALAKQDRRVMEDIRAAMGR
jgi:hypothetical protein